MQAIDDFLNGNLSDAKVRARKAGRLRTQNALREYGYGAEAILAILNYLFDGGSFQAACDAQERERKF